MTIRQILVGAAAVGATIGLLVHRLPSRDDKPVKIAKLQSIKPASKASPRAASPSAQRHKNRRDQPLKTARA